MARKLTDADVTRLRELASEGRSAASLGREFGVTGQYVGRLLRGVARPELEGGDANLTTVRALEGFLAGVELDAVGLVLAEAARALAAKLDTCRASETA